MGNGRVDGAVDVGDMFDALGKMGHHRALAGGAAVGRGVEADEGIVFVEVGEGGLEVGEQGVELGKSTCPAVDQKDVLRAGAVCVDGVGVAGGVLVEGLDEFVLPRLFPFGDRERVGREEPAPRQARGQRSA